MISKVVSLLPFNSQEILERHGANTEAPNVVNIALHMKEDDMPESDCNKPVIDSVHNQDSVEFLSFFVALDKSESLSV